MRDEPSDHFDMGIAQDSRVLVTPSPKPHFVKQKATNLYICAFDVCVCVVGGTFWLAGKSCSFPWLRYIMLFFLYFFFHGSFPCYHVLTRTSFADLVIWKGRLLSASGWAGPCRRRSCCGPHTVSTLRSCLASALCECHAHPTSLAGVARCCRLAQRTPQRCAHWTLLKCSFCKGRSVDTLKYIMLLYNTVYICIWIVVSFSARPCHFCSDFQGINELQKQESQNAVNATPSACVVY